MRVEQVRFFENSVPLKPLVNPPVSYSKNSHLKGVDAFFWDTPTAHMYQTFLNSTFSGTPHIWLVNPWFPIDIPLNPVIHWWSSGIVPFPDCPMTKSGWKSEIEEDTPKNPMVLWFIYHNQTWHGCIAKFQTHLPYLTILLMHLIDIHLCLRSSPSYPQKMLGLNAPNIKLCPLKIIAESR